MANDKLIHRAYDNYSKIIVCTSKVSIADLHKSLDYKTCHKMCFLTPASNDSKRPGKWLS